MITLDINDVDINYLLIGENCFWVDSIKLFNFNRLNCINDRKTEIENQIDNKLTIKPCMELHVRLIISIMHQLFRSHNVIICSDLITIIQKGERYTHTHTLTH